MSAQDIMRLLPLVILAGGILSVLLVIAFRRDHKLVFGFTLIVLFVALLVSFFTAPDPASPLHDQFLIDRFGYYYMSLILLTTLVIAVFGYISLRNFYPEKRKEEFYPLLMTASLGASAMAFSTHFISFFVSLEVLSVSLYGLIAYYREHEKAVEAGLKYLILAALSASFLLLGMALVYTYTGTMDFASLAAVTPEADGLMNILLLAGIGLMIVGIGFKLAAVPFHIWTPDVYEGASSPVSAFVATVSKGSIVALLLRFFIMSDLYRFESIVWIFTIISVLSMLMGNLLALMQNNVKRLLAYSSIAHFGYLLIAVIAGEEWGLPAATFYLTIYIVTIVAAFGLVTLLSQSQEEAVDIEDYRGLFWKRPLLATAFTVSLLSLAGIPATAGFTGKFFVLSAGVNTAQWVLAVTLVIGSVIGLYYYLRVIIVMIYQDKEAVPAPKVSKVVSILSGSVALIVLTAVIIWLGTYPRWLLDLVSSLGG